MSAADQPAWVFAGDAPGVWWVVHARSPRFAGRLYSAEEFASDRRLAALPAHGIDRPMPVHFNLGNDVLVVTDFLDPLVIDEGESPQAAILTDGMIEALHACQAAITRVAASDPGFAPLAERSEAFLVGWQIRANADRSLELLHVSGAWVHAEFDADGDCEATLRAPPRDTCRQGWDEALLQQRLERVAGERALLVDEGWWRAPAEGGGVLASDVFSVLARQQPAQLHWTVVGRSHPATAARVDYVGLCVAGPLPLVCATAVEIDRRSPLLHGDLPLHSDEIHALLALLPGYGLCVSLGLAAAARFALYQEDAADSGARRRSGALPRYPCEVELHGGGELLAGVVFAPADSRGRFRVVIAPHAPAQPLGGDSSILLPFDCLGLQREQFHVPAYLQAGD